MRLMISPSKNAKSFYVIKSVQKNGKNTSEIVEKLGTETFIKETYGVDDAEAWARSHVNELNAAEKAAKDVEHFVRFSANELIPAGKQLSFNTGYLFFKEFTISLDYLLSAKRSKRIMLSLMTLMLSFQGLFMAGFFFLLQNCRAMNSQRNF